MIEQQPNFARIDGGRDRDRTCDPYHVKVVLLACDRLLGIVRANNFLRFIAVSP
jgi:hypothetical protein